MLSSRPLPFLRLIVFVLAITLAFSSVVAVSAQEDQNQDQDRQTQQDQQRQRDELQQLEEEQQFLEEERQQIEEEIQQLEEENAPQRQIRQREQALRQIERAQRQIEQQIQRVERQREVQPDQQQRDELQQLEEERQQLEEEIQQLEEEDAPQRQIRQRERELRQVEREIQQLEQQQDQQDRRRQAQQVTMRELKRSPEDFEGQRIQITGDLEETLLPHTFALDVRGQQVIVLAAPQDVPDDAQEVTVVGTVHLLTLGNLLRSLGIDVTASDMEFFLGDENDLILIAAERVTTDREAAEADGRQGRVQQERLEDVVRNPEDFTNRNIAVTGAVGQEVDQDAFTLETRRGDEILVVGEQGAVPRNLGDEVEVQGQVRESFDRRDVGDELGRQLNRRDFREFEGQTFIMADQVQATQQQGQQDRQQEQEAQTVEVGLTEFEINMPTSLEPGRTTFVVTNTGSIVHNFVIEGQGIEREFEQNLQPGETREMTVDLEPGRYTIYCPVGNHRDLGMEIQVRAR